MKVVMHLQVKYWAHQVCKSLKATNKTFSVLQFKCRDYFRSCSIFSLSTSTALGLSCDWWCEDVSHSQHSAIICSTSVCQRRAWIAPPPLPLLPSSPSSRGEREFPFPVIPKNGGLWFKIKIGVQSKLHVNVSNQATVFVWQNHMSAMVSSKTFSFPSRHCSA